MISLTILELLYLVLTLFVVVIGVLLTLVLIRVLRILRVGTELADMYFSVKDMLANIHLIPEILKQKLLETFGDKREQSEEEQGEEQKKES